MFVQEFEWDSINEAHIMKKNILPEEVEEVFLENYIIGNAKNNRMFALGRTIEGRYLTVVYEIISKGNIRVITARKMKDTERKYYKKKRGYK